jgi:hypothetical protein
MSAPTPTNDLDRTDQSQFWRQRTIHNFLIFFLYKRKKKNIDPVKDIREGKDRERPTEEGEE